MRDRVAEEDVGLDAARGGRVLCRLHKDVPQRLGDPRCGRGPVTFETLHARSDQDH